MSGLTSRALALIQRYLAMAEAAGRTEEAAMLQAAVERLIDDLLHPGRGGLHPDHPRQAYAWAA